MGKFIDLTGRRFGRLTVMSRSENTKNGQLMWLCRCDCGNTGVYLGNNLKKGNTKSCGCFRRDIGVELGRRRVSHGLTESRLFEIWHGMLQRCYNPKSIGYKDYGGRGISVCMEWKDDFLSFYEWAIANGYQDNLTIDRADVNGNYCPDNCRWATCKEQCNNKRNNRLLNFNGELKTVTQWAELIGIHEETIRSRIRRGWSVEKALTTQVTGGKRK